MVLATPKYGAVVSASVEALGASDAGWREQFGGMFHKANGLSFSFVRFARFSALFFCFQRTESNLHK